MAYYLGVDIGGTKCAVCVGTETGEVLKRFVIPTVGTPLVVLEHLAHAMQDYVSDFTPIEAIGIVCGGPLDVATGRIQSPPNLPGWDNVAVVDFFQERFELLAFLMNDANAGALAEWRFGAGRGSRNMMFCTMGTGFGCGLILNEQVFEGSNGNAGELGHVRLTAAGPVGYGKVGSVEGWCSGGGIAQIARKRLSADKGKSMLYGQSNVTALAVAEAARQGDSLALDIYAEVGRMLGAALAGAIDLLNLECVVIGSIFARQEVFIRPTMEEVLQAECLAQSLAVCRIYPAELGEAIGDTAALAVAMKGKNKS